MPSASANNQDRSTCLSLIPFSAQTLSSEVTPNDCRHWRKIQKESLHECPAVSEWHNSHIAYKVLPKYSVSWRML